MIVDGAAGRTRPARGNGGTAGIHAATLRGGNASRQRGTRDVLTPRRSANTRPASRVIGRTRRLRPAGTLRVTRWPLPAHGGRGSQGPRTADGCGAGDAVSSFVVTPDLAEWLWETCRRLECAPAALVRCAVDYEASGRLQINRASRWQGRSTERARLTIRLSVLQAAHLESAIRRPGYGGKSAGVAEDVVAAESGRRPTSVRVKCKVVTNKNVASERQKARAKTRAFGLLSNFLGDGDARPVEAATTCSLQHRRFPQTTN